MALFFVSYLLTFFYSDRSVVHKNTRVLFTKQHGFHYLPQRILFLSLWLYPSRKWRLQENKFRYLKIKKTYDPKVVNNPDMFFSYVFCNTFYLFCFLIASHGSIIHPFFSTLILLFIAFGKWRRWVIKPKPNYFWGVVRWIYFPVLNYTNTD